MARLSRARSIASRRQDGPAIPEIGGWQRGQRLALHSVRGVSPGQLGEHGDVPRHGVARQPRGEELDQPGRIERLASSRSGEPG